MKLVFRPAAEIDISNAYEWYEKRQPKLGKAFILEVERLLERIKKNSELYSTALGSTRRALCKRFPYAVYFAEKDSMIVILAVLHQRRNPITWHNRN